MISLLEEFYDALWSDIEYRLTPEEETKEARTFSRLALLAELPVGLALAGVKTIYQLSAYTLNYTKNFFYPPRPIGITNDFSPLLENPLNWESIENIREKITLGHNNPNFLFGTATCTYQDSGAVHCPQSQWASWEKKVVEENNRSGQSANLFELYKTEEGRKKVIEKLQKLGVNSYRFSIEWSHLQPGSKEDWEEDKLQIYVDLCKSLRDHGISPMVTLHHFSEPHWFHSKGSFEKEGNIEDFLSFSEKVFKKLTKKHNDKPLVEYFCTINEPAIEAFSRFVLGAFSPGKMFNFTRAANFLKGALKAHCLAYEKLKEIAKEQETIKIGIVHQYLKFIPTCAPLSPITEVLTRLVNDLSLNFFKQKGSEKVLFDFSAPFVRVKDTDMPQPKTDFVGLQYYVRPMIGLSGSTGNSPMTQMPFCEDPEGLYEAIIETHKAYNAPVIITENGISTHDDTQRERYITRALYTAEQAGEKIGKENLQGYYLWSFCDNSEWDRGMNPQKFGLFNQKLEIKEGGKAYIEILSKWRKTLKPSEEDDEKKSDEK